MLFGSVEVRHKRDGFRFLDYHFRGFPTDKSDVTLKLESSLPWGPMPYLYLKEEGKSVVTS